MEQMNKFDRRFWLRLWKLTKPYWVSDQKWRALGLLATIIAVGVLSIGIGAAFSFINRDLLNDLAKRDRAGVWSQLWKVLIASVFFIPISAYFPWLIGHLTILWREWMTRQFLGRSFTNRAFYAINSAGHVDNPDQRISEDINSFAGSTLTFVLTFLNAPITGITYFVILWTISAKLALFMLLYALVGSYVSILVGRRLVSINFDQQRYEADFRFGLVHVRDNAESIAMYGGEPYEEQQLHKRFAKLVRNFNLLIRWQRHLAFVTAAYNDPVALLPWFLLAGAYFAGKVELGQLNQAGAAFITLKGSVSVVVNQFNLIANYACVVNRLAEFEEHCDSAIGHVGDGYEIEIERAEAALRLESLTLATPGHERTLIRDLSLAAVRNQSILIQGESGAGKTSLLRAIAGLWKSGSGKIARPDLEDLMFLPQRPYLVLGTLRDQLRYPRVIEASDEQLLSTLERVNLADLPARVGGFDSERNWSDFLSPGEQQRLAFARVLLHSPTFAFLDEATSALDSANEETLYAQLGGVTAISVGHRTSLLKHHTRVLHLAGDSTWRLSESGRTPPEKPDPRTMA
jgi:putative ATP-binding cassette transporter